jgi:PAS domain S-box-containing protein
MVAERVDPSDRPAGEVEQALAGGTPHTVGWFRFFFDDQRWEWSSEVQRMHGYQPGTVTPTTELVLSHKHPEDLQRVAATLEEIRRTRQAFSTRPRIYDRQGRERHVVVVGDQLYNDAGDVIGTHGFYIDVTPAMIDERQQMVTEAVVEISERRAAIEQAKGMLMLAYGINADTAFGLLRWRSQETNVKLRQLAEQVVNDFLQASRDQPVPMRARYDHLLLTAHQRVPGGDPSLSGLAEFGESD